MLRIAAPLRALAQRFSFLLLVLVAIALMLVGKIDTIVIDNIRGRIDDAFVPVMGALSRPAATAARVIEGIQELAGIRAENQRLRAENAALLQWQQAALKLESENRTMRDMLHVVPDAAISYVSGRVVADAGGPFVRTILVTAGRRDGARKGQAAMAGPGLIGRVIEVGETSSRILLITDLNSRIPVIMESSRQRAVMSGDNSEQPRLLYAVTDVPLQIGDRVVTSGHGGTLPPGLPVGKVASVTDHGIRVQPMVDLSRLEMVTLVDFGLATNLLGEAPKPGALP